MQLVLILENIRSLHNVGSIFRISDGAGVSKLYLTGITGYPEKKDDARFPWEIEKVEKGIEKTALGAQKYVDWEYVEKAADVVEALKSEGFQIVALELTEDSVNLFEVDERLSGEKVALVVGHERDGVSDELLKLADITVHIPMRGRKKSLNVSTATAVALYELLH